MKRKLLSFVLTLAMLVGMLSVMGAVSFGASAEEVTKFTANFAELNNSGEFTGSGSKLTIKYNDPTTDTSATNLANHNWLSTRFDSYMNYTSIEQRSYFSQGDADKGSYFVYGALNALGGMADAYRGLMFENASPGGELFWSINTLVPKYDGEAIAVKNFEATVKFAMTNSLSGGLLFAFH
ncbi:MAG: hypothetical protein J6L00_05990, partial [Clostridia bacterium]|nr:hypothetical protein [Clostridia bacterium]